MRIRKRLRIIFCIFFVEYLQKYTNFASKKVMNS